MHVVSNCVGLAVGAGPAHAGRRRGEDDQDAGGLMRTSTAMRMDNATAGRRLRSRLMPIIGSILKLEEIERGVNNGNCLEV